MPCTPALRREPSDTGARVPQGSALLAERATELALGSRRDVDMSGPTIVVGAGIGGLAAAMELSARGHAVTVIDKAPAVGGKMRTVDVAGHPVDSGPTVLTMREVFEALFARSGSRLQDEVVLRPLAVLARHAWLDGARLDLFSDPERSAAAIEAAFGRREAEGFVRFGEHTQRIYAAVREPFLDNDAAGLWTLFKRLSFRQVRQLARVDWHRSMWRALHEFFRDPRLIQLFARYATYYGSSPFHAPATLNLIAHVEQRGVWAVQGGMIELARAMASRIRAAGGQIHLGTPVEEILVDGGRVSGVRLAGGEVRRAAAVVLNATPEAAAGGRLGEAIRGAVRPANAERSLSALTWSMVGRVRDFPLAYHNVLFSDDYRREFDQLATGRLPDPPTAYICAQDRDPTDPSPGVDARSQRLMCIINAPARGDDPSFCVEIERCQERCFEQMARCGLTLEVEPTHVVRTTPHDFARMFPGSGGALYGTATHGSLATFSRPGARTKLPGLYMVGGGVHPGAGIPMVALGGRLAADSVHADLASTLRSPTVATFGGTSTGSVPMATKR